MEGGTYKWADFLAPGGTGCKQIALLFVVQQPFLRTFSSIEERQELARNSGFDHSDTIK